MKSLSFGDRRHLGNHNIGRGNSLEEKCLDRFRSLELEQKDEPPPGERVAFFDAEEHHCRWPYGRMSDGTFSFCGRRVVNSLSSWCPAHERRAFPFGH